MDDMIEVFGSEVGPHFWITADRVEPEKMEFLYSHYSIHTIRVPVYDFKGQANLLRHVCELRGYTDTFDFEALEVRLHLPHTPPPPSPSSPSSPASPADPQQHGDALTIPLGPPPHPAATGGGGGETKSASGGADAKGDQGGSSSSLPLSRLAQPSSSLSSRAPPLSSRGAKPVADSVVIRICSDAVPIAVADLDAAVAVTSGLMGMGRRAGHRSDHLLKAKPKRRGKVRPVRPQGGIMYQTMIHLSERLKRMHTDKHVTFDLDSVDWQAVPMEVGRYPCSAAVRLAMRTPTQIDHLGRPVSYLAVPAGEQQQQGSRYRGGGAGRGAGGGGVWTSGGGAQRSEGAEIGAPALPGAPPAPPQQPKLGHMDSRDGVLDAISNGVFHLRLTSKELSAAAERAGDGNAEKLPDKNGVPGGGTAGHAGQDGKRSVSSVSFAPSSTATESSRDSSNGGGGEEDDVMLEGEDESDVVARFWVVCNSSNQEDIRAGMYTCTLAFIRKAFAAELARLTDITCWRDPVLSTSGSTPPTVRWKTRR